MNKRELLGKGNWSIIGHDGWSRQQIGEHWLDPETPVERLLADTIREGEDWQPAFAIYKQWQKVGRRIQQVKIKVIPLS